MAKTTQKTKSFTDFASSLSKGELSTSKKSDEVGAHRGKPESKVASAHATRSVGHAPHNDRAAGYLSRLAASGLHDDEPFHDDLGAPRPPEPTTLPARISKEVSHGVDTPTWHMVKNLPGMYSSAIRALGKQVFAHFTSTRIEEIQIMCSITNSDRELLVTGDYIKRHGRKDDAMTMRFEALFPGYEANIHVYHLDGETFLVMADFMGKYIYRWMDATNHKKLT